MPSGLPKRFDPQRLAAQQDVLTGELDTGMMPRLSGMLAGDAPKPVSFEIRAYRDEAKRLVISGRAQAKLDCTCQRCMEPVALAIETDFTLAMVSDEEAAKNLPPDLDPLIPEHPTDVDLPALLEDELILALPPIPVHESEADCGERAQFATSQEKENEFDGGAKKENPFAVLKKLKNGNTDRGN